MERLTRCTNKQTRNSAIDAARQIMLLMIVISRTLSGTIVVRLAILIVSVSKKKSIKGSVIKTKRINNKKTQSKQFAMAEDGKNDSDVESDSDSSLIYLYKIDSELTKFDTV